MAAVITSVNPIASTPLAVARLRRGNVPTLFGPSCVASMLAGVGICLLLPALPPRWLWLLLLAAGLVATLWRTPLRPIGALLFGMASAR